MVNISPCANSPLYSPFPSLHLKKTPRRRPPPPSKKRKMQKTTPQNIPHFSHVPTSVS